jgi:hypothetical protein
VSVGDTAIITLKVDANAAVLNAIQGDITFSPAGDVAVDEFSLAGSAFGLWPRTPSLSQAGDSVSFTGGVPGGFSIEGATVFKIIVQAKKAGSITISPQHISVFANDGKGTIIPAQVKNLVIKVLPSKAGAAGINDWSAIVSKDTTPPEPFIVVLGQDPSVFSGKKFAFFSALDNQSGIDHYDVSENAAPAVRSGSTYVFQNQSGDITLNVVAYDKAGNKTSTTYSTTLTGETINWKPVLITVLILVIIYFIFKKIWPRSKHNKKDGSKTA